MSGRLMLSCAVFLMAGLYLALHVNPEFRRLRRYPPANSTLAAARLQSYAAAQAIFREEDRDGDARDDYAHSLYELWRPDGSADRPLVTEWVAKSTTKAVNPGGYCFVMMSPDSGAPDTDPSLPPLVALPCEYGRTGMLTVLVRHDGTVYCRDTAGELPDALPADPEAEGWILWE